MTPARMVVVGVGNRSDPLDRIGPTVADRVARRAADDVEVVTVADPSRLVELARGRAAMVVVDAARLPIPQPGPLVLSPDELVATSASRALGSHGLALPDALALGSVLGRLPPRTHVVAVPVDPALQQPPAADAAIDEAVELVLRLVDEARAAG